MNDVTIRHAETEAEIAACFPVIALLRPHLSGVEELVTRVACQRAAGYRLLAAWRDGAPIGIAGYRFEENLIRGKFVYVDDLVTAAEARRNRIGARLLDAVSAIGRDAGCAHLVLDTALDNVLGHRFYYRQGCWREPCASAGRSRRNETGVDDDPANPGQPAAAGVEPAAYRPDRRSDCGAAV